ncbi:MAG: ATP-binding cassette domain-containing protein [Acidobacteriaceae bacterium]|nr:ATP-binding cassette domain-containing protein [Acidobacteriaceae bacterium]MBV9778641.1 ATP-binding cassette domain-containing protein [Acidobacteriaceae bacterium]
MSLGQIEMFAWSAEEAGRCLSALVQKARLMSRCVEVENPPHPDGRWLERASKHIGLEADQVEIGLRDLEQELPAAFPAMLRLNSSFYLAVVRANRRKLWVLTPTQKTECISIEDVCQIIREPAEYGIHASLQELVDAARIPHNRRQRTVRLLSREQVSDSRFDQCWIFRPPTGARPFPWLKQVNAIPKGITLLIAHIAQYSLWLLSWIIVGRMSFEGRMDRGWLLAWALILMTLIPFRVLTTRLQGQLAIGLGGLLKRRLLYGLMRLGPEEMRSKGIGSFLGQALEAETVETLALSGAVAGMLATIELAASGFVLGRLALLLVLWFGIVLALAWRVFARYQRWTDTRLEMTHDLIESMVGHRTRLVQQQPDAWHDSEDQALHDYFEKSISLDRSVTMLVAAIPRGWLVAGLTCLAPMIALAQISPGHIAVLLGGILLAFTALKRLTVSLTDIAGAFVVWKRLAPLFRAAARTENLGEMRTAEADCAGGASKVIEADRLTYRYRTESAPVVQACSLTIKRGDRILLEGPSGGGKTTFASLLCGMRQPESGLLLSNGLDMHTLGTDRWRERVVAAPQFHENYILTETLAFNLLMGRRWPPTAADMQDAESLCHRLGLGHLLDTMPSGMQQMVGEGGWQLSHGERSRIYIARALLGRADLVILDESFAALDPENLRIALECTLERAPTLMVIAHP